MKKILIILKFVLTFLFLCVCVKSFSFGEIIVNYQQFEEIPMCHYITPYEQIAL